MNPTDQPTPTPETHQCAMCGHAWQHGLSGDHSCARVLKAALEAEQEGNRTLSLTMGGMKEGKNFREFCKRVATERDAALAEREKLREQMRQAVDMLTICEAAMEAIEEVYPSPARFATSLDSSPRPRKGTRFGAEREAETQTMRSSATAPTSAPT